MAGVAAATSIAAPQACPDLSSLQAATERKDDSRPERTAVDQFVAEAQALTRILSDVNLAKAIALYEQAIAADSQDAAAHILLARAHKSSQRYLSVKKDIALARAWEHLSKGRTLEPANIDGLYLLADQALRWLDKAIDDRGGGCSGSSTTRPGHRCAMIHASSPFNVARAGRFMTHRSIARRRTSFR